MGEAEHARGEDRSGGKPDPAAVPGKPSGTRRMIHILGAALVVVVLPVVVLYLLLGELGARAVVIGLLLGVLGSKLGGTRRMLYLAPAVGVAEDWGRSPPTTGRGWVAGGAAGSSRARGCGSGGCPSLLMPAFAATFPVATSSPGQAAAYGAIVGIATLYGIVLARRFGAAGRRGPAGPLPAAIGVALVFGVALGGAAAIGVALGWTEPYWVPEPILILLVHPHR